MSKPNIFTEFLDHYLPDVNATIPLDSPVWPGCSVLHLAVLMTDNPKLWDEFFEKSDSQRQLDSLLQIQEFTEEDKINYRKRIDICLEKGCRVDIKNAQGSTPIHLAFKMRKTDITDTLLSKCQEQSVTPNDLSFLHIACAIGNVDVVERLLNKGADVNSQTRVSFEWFYACPSCKIVSVPVNSTALHIAATFQHKKIVELLLDQGGNVYAKNSLELTPIHLSMDPCINKNHVKRKSTARLLLDKTLNLKESLSSCGLSHLHIAAYADDSETIEKLLATWANIDSIFKITTLELDHLADYANRTPLHLAIFMRSEKAIATLIQNGADIFQQTPEIHTPMQVLSRRFCNQDEPELVRNCIVNRFKKDTRFNEAVDVNGVTLLHVACRIFDFNWAKKLLENGADVNAKILEDEKRYGWKGATPLFILILAISVDVEDLKHNERFVKLLIDYGANILDVRFNCMSPLLLSHFLACKRTVSRDHKINYDIDDLYGNVTLPIADFLLKNQLTYKVNPVNRYGFSHFHYACIRNQVDIVRKYLDNGIDVNHTANVKFGDIITINATNFTPLHFAMHYRSKEVAILLIERGADVHAVNGDKETPLHIAAMAGFVDSSLTKFLLSKRAYINARSKSDSTPIDRMIDRCKSITHHQLKFFIENGAIINLVHGSGVGRIGLLMRNAKSTDRELILDEIINFCDIKNAIKNRFNPILNIVSVDQENKLTLDFYVKVIQKFIDMGCDIDRQNDEGDTALHQAVFYKNVEAVEALLSLGADLNIINKKGKPAINVTFTSKTRCTRTAKILAHHMWKMKRVCLKSHELCESGMLEIFEWIPLDQDLPRQCGDELAKLLDKDMGGFNMRCFLRERGATMNYPTMSYVQRENLRKLFGNSEQLQKDFPQFCGLLIIQYRKALNRLKMHKIAMNLLPFAISVNLPDLCVENILQYFDNDELAYFVKEHTDKA